MPPADSYDRVRDWALGRLPPDDVARLEREMAVDADLRAAADDYRAVARWTEPLVADVPQSRLRFEDVVPASEVEAPPVPRLLSRRRAAAVAAALLLAGVGAWALVRRPAGPVVLREVRLFANAGAPPPAMLADYEPVADGAIRWIDSAADARAVARATGRDVFVYGHFQGCPYCEKMERTTLRDASVVEVVREVVPLRVDVGALDKAEAQRLMERGWPYFAVQTPDGVTVNEFAGMLKAPAMRRAIGDAVAAATPPPPPWERAKAEAIRAGRALEARTAIERARAKDASDRAAAQADLAAAAKRLAGTPAGADLERVLERWKEVGAFPALEEAPR